jgi:hypothetical protein
MLIRKVVIFPKILLLLEEKRNRRLDFEKIYQYSTDNYD